MGRGENLNTTLVEIFLNDGKNQFSKLAQVEWKNIPRKGDFYLDNRTKSVYEIDCVIYEDLNTILIVKGPSNQFSTIHDILYNRGSK